MLDCQKIADEAEVIISGLAFEKCADGIKVYDLNDGEGVAVFKPDETLIETNMDDIQLAIAKRNMRSAMKYMEEDDAKVLSV